MYIINLIEMSQSIEWLSFLSFFNENINNNNRLRRKIFNMAHFTQCFFAFFFKLLMSYSFILSIIGSHKNSHPKCKIHIDTHRIYIYYYFIIVMYEINKGVRYGIHSSQPLNNLQILLDFVAAEV